MRVIGFLASVAACLTIAQAQSNAEVHSNSNARSNASESTTAEENRIWGGKVANIKYTPYIVNLRPAGKRSLCGGSLIASQFVLTAAHCIKEGRPLFAAIGSEYNIGEEDGEHFAVTEAFVHPNYSNITKRWDLAILKLNGSSKITPVQLGRPDGSDEEVGKMAIVRGWGRTEDKKPSHELLEVDLKIISNEECNKAYPGSITEDMLCAGQGGKKDSCQGDSGGPLMRNGRLIGAVSWGGDCGANAGIYARLSKMHDFIDKFIGSGNSNAIPKPDASKVPAVPATNAPVATPSGTPSTTPQKPATSTQSSPPNGSAAGAKPATGNINFSALSGDKPALSGSKATGATITTPKPGK